MTVERITRALATLEKKVDARGFVTDDTLLRTIRAAHEDNGMESDARVAVVLRAPADEADLRELDAWLNEKLGHALPSQVRALYERTDGIWAGDVGSATEDLRATRSYEAGVRPLEMVLSDMDEVLAIQRKDGVGHPSMIPFFDVPDQGYHVVEVPSGRVIAYWLDEGEPLSLAGRPVIASSLAEWLERWIASGFDTFFWNAEPPPPAQPAAPADAPPAVGDALALFREAAARDKRNLTLAYAVISAAGFVGIAMAISGELDRGLIIPSIAVAFVGVLGLAVAFMRKNEALTLLERSPETIVWIFTTYLSPDDRAQITFGTLAGKLVGIVLVRKEDEAAATASARSIAPRARVGYDPEWTTELFRDPRAFAKRVVPARAPAAHRSTR